MRYFDEDKNLISVDDYDREDWKIKEELINHINWKYVITQEAKGHYEHVETIHHDDGPDSYIDEWVEDQPEIGSWVHTSSLGYSTDGLEPIPDTQAHDFIIDYDETITILRPWTDEEKAERERQKEREEEAERKYKAERQMIEELPEFEGDTEDSVCELYELITGGNAGTSAIAKMYARRILDGKITLDDVPESIREEVRKILEENKKE